MTNVYHLCKKEGGEYKPVLDDISGIQVGGGNLLEIVANLNHNAIYKEDNGGKPYSYHKHTDIINQKTFKLQAPFINSKLSKELEKVNN